MIGNASTMAPVSRDDIPFLCRFTSNRVELSAINNLNTGICVSQASGTSGISAYVVPRYYVVIRSEASDTDTVAIVPRDNIPLTGGYATYNVRLSTTTNSNSIS